ncbi:serine/threonine protein kinase [Spirulina subsalsa]|uniref:serine/threonine protein kinase n=1 Tax=Spirulina subsalsa TaxID=54311 RepID=UPI0002EAA80F|nr:serine/threonine-protein kinase [Spirulina subsalsa]
MSFIHCINPDCPAPYPQPQHHKFCQRCGTSLCLQNRYIPLERLGAGGFAAIYTVWDLEQQEEKVLKVLTVISDKALQLFAQEALVLRTLRHPGVPLVETHNSFFEIRTPKRGIYCLVMEKITGKNLEEFLQEYYPGGCPETLVYHWLGQALSILEELHKRHIVHRDIKPSNLMLQTAGSGIGGGIPLVLIDFGGAKQIDSSPSSTRLFSSGYSPPEQVIGGGVEPTADIYALGRTMIHLLTGKYPTDMEDINTGELNWRPFTQVSPAFADLLDDMVRLDPKLRPQNVRRVKKRWGKLSQVKQQARSEAIARWFESAQNNLVWGLQWGQDTLSQMGHWSWEFLQYLGRASLNTLTEMVSGGIGAVFGSAVGFMILQFPSWRDWLLYQINDEFLGRLQGLELEVEAGILVCAIAGLGTGWGLAKAGRFGQRGYALFCAIAGFVGYALAWILYQSLMISDLYRFLSLIGVSVTILTLSLGLPSHHWLHLSVILLATGGIFGSLTHLNQIEFFIKILQFSDLIQTVAFFALIGMSIGLALGLSHYIFLPLLYWFKREPINR